MQSTNFFRASLAIVATALVGLNAEAKVFNGVANTELQWNGDDQMNFQAMLRLNLDVPLWKGASLQAATIHMANTYGNVLEVPDFQGYSNLLADNCIAGIAVLDLRQEWERDWGKAALLAGVRNCNEDFFATDYTLFFLGVSTGIIPTIWGNYPLANYPIASMGLHAQIDWNNGWAFKTSFYNGQGYNGWQKGNMPFTVRLNQDGFINLSEASYSTEAGSHYALGFAAHSRMFDAAEPYRDGSATIYAYIEQALGEHWHLLAHFSENTNSDNICIRHAEVGGIFESVTKKNQRPYGLGLSFNYAAFYAGEANEFSLEASYNLAINDTFTFHPAFHWINTDGHNSTVLEARISVAF